MTTTEADGASEGDLELVREGVWRLLVKMIVQERLARRALTDSEEG